MSTQMDETFTRAVSPGAERLLAGVALAAAGSNMKDGKPQDDFLAAYGTLQLDPTSGPVTTKTVMWIASCTKVVTAIAALQCVERGLFGLDSSADVERLLPEWKDLQILTGFEGEQPILKDAKNKITLRQLLTMTSGLTYDFMSPDLMKWRKSRGEPRKAMVGKCVDGFVHPLIFEPGEGFAYGQGDDLAGLMVARANSCSLEEYMRKHMFDVLGMDDTSFWPLKHSDLGKRLMPMTTRPSPDEPLIDGHAPGAMIRGIPLHFEEEFGGGGLFSTAEDFLKMLKSICFNDGRLLKRESVELLFTPDLSPQNHAGLLQNLSIPALANAMIPGEPLVGTPGAGEWTHSVGGLLGLTDKDYGMKAPWLQWGGSLNLKWWINREGGSCGLFFTQLAPAGETRHHVLTNLFQEEMVRKFGSAQA